MVSLKQTTHKYRLRLRRAFRRRKRHAEDAVAYADDSVNRFVLRRFKNLYKVRRFVLAWVVLLVCIGVGSIWQVRGLERHYLELAPTGGGVYREGIIGSFTNANPLFAVTNVDSSVSRLVFSSLFTVSPEGELKPDLATGYNVNDTGTVHTVTLRDNVVWHDGHAFDAGDVAFTYNTIKNADVNSPLFSSWRGVKVEVVDDRTIKFTIPDTLGSFRFSMTNGIVPEHILSDVEPADLRSSRFNAVSPVGTGPFSYSGVERSGIDPDERTDKITFTANDDYFRGDVQLDGVVLRTYQNEEDIVADFDKQLITAMVGLGTLPDNIPDTQDIVEYNTPLRDSVMAFFNTSSEILRETSVRKALVRASDTQMIRERLPYQLVAVDSPFLKTHTAYDPERVQLSPDSDVARELLDAADWKLADDGIRYKDGQPLSIRIVSQSLPEFSTVAQTLQEQWSAIGVDLQVDLQQEEDIQSDKIVTDHLYDVLLYGVAIGPDPDVFAYWHSSQADPRIVTRLNFSEYSSDVADEALEAGRTRTDDELRSIKYRPFLNAWTKDAPALALYQPRFLFVSRVDISGYVNGQYNTSSDRYFNVHEWQIRKEKTVKTP